MVKSNKKLIEVALPLEAINKASAREKSIRHGHPSTLHLWWARRPLAAARAVIFSQMVDDPSEYVDTLRQDPKLKRAAESALKAKRKLWVEAKALHKKVEGTKVEVPEPGPEPTLDEMLADQERQRLFKIIEQLVLWENTTNEEVLQAARDEIWQSWRRTCLDNVDHPRAKELFDRSKLPAFHDPFAGGGALPLEAQRLGLESHASDLNPVAVLINKAMIEIPPRFAGKPPVRPRSKDDPPEFMKREWIRAQGLAEDVRYYGQWMRDEAERRIGKLYPNIEVTAEMAKGRPDLKPYIGRQLTVIAWLWARTVKSPNPAFAKVDVPLVSSFTLSTKPGKEAHIEPLIGGGEYRFTVKVGKSSGSEGAKSGTKLSRGANFKCLMSGTPISGDYIKAEGKAGRMGSRMMAIVAEGDRCRLYIPPTPEQESAARDAKPEWRPTIPISGSTQYVGVKPYGMEQFDALFTERQLTALSTLSELIGEARSRIVRDALASGQAQDSRALNALGVGAQAYGEAVAVYLGLALSRLSDMCNSLCGWEVTKTQVRHLFTRQAIPMMWDFAENNVFGEAAGAYTVSLGNMAKALENVSTYSPGFVYHEDAQNQGVSAGKLVSTDPPYYDNVPYADLSDFFYVWLRRSLHQVFPELFSTVAVPKAEELVAFAYRHKQGKLGAEAFFLTGMTHAMHRLSEQAHPAFPVTIFYAFKQVESDDIEGTTNTGWETFLAAVIEAGFAISGTWPMRTELSNRMRGMDSNALASSIVLVCRKRSTTASIATRRDFVSALKAELPHALSMLQRGNIEPVDLEQAAIGPGMAVYTRYSSVLDAEGRPLSVRGALALINQTLDEALAEQEGEFDPDTRWALVWFDEHGYAEGEFGKANTLATAKATSVAGLATAGILQSRQGKVRLFAPAELPSHWDPERDERLPIWEALHHLVRVLESEGEYGAALLAKQLGPRASVARELAYRLHSICGRRKRSKEAQAFNGLVKSWPEIDRISRGEAPVPSAKAQVDAFEQE